KDEEEQFVANDRADHGHLGLAGGQPLRFAHFMQAAEAQLKCYKDQDDAGGGEEAMQRDSQCALEEEQPHGNGGGDSRHGPDPKLEALGGQFDGAEDEGKLDPFSKDHQEYEQENAPSSGFFGACRIRFHLLLNIFFQVARNAVHPYDHRNDETGGHQKEQALEAVLVDSPVFQRDAHA